MKKIKIFSICVVFLFANYCWAMSELPTECPPANQIKNFQFELKPVSSGDGFSLSFGYNYNHPNSRIKMYAFITPALKAKNEFEATKLLDKVLNQLTDPVLLRDAKNVTCVYPAKSGYSINYLYTDTSFEVISQPAIIPEV